MQARDIMSRSVITIAPDVSVQDAARLLADYRISGVPVVDEEQRILGILTEADIIAKEGKTVADLMSVRVISVREDTPVDDIARLLASNQIKRVPVLCGDQVAGIVSRADIVRMMASRWVCPVCGEIQQGENPDECSACGASSAFFEHDVDPRTQISTRE